MSDTPQRRVVCAANRLLSDFGDEVGIVCSARHFDPLMRRQMEQSNVTMAGWKVSQQGFIDQWGAFMDREEALVVALAAGQRIKRCGGDETRLYSENLY